MQLVPSEIGGAQKAGVLIR